MEWRVEIGTECLDNLRLMDILSGSMLALFSSTSSLLPALHRTKDAKSVTNMVQSVGATFEDLLSALRPFVSAMYRCRCHIETSPSTKELLYKEATAPRSVSNKGDRYQNLGAQNCRGTNVARNECRQE
ncbi:hypothetical protein CLAIMM_15006 [Cladophialophora immunda]|nr:hypothetical protein CLAIMM_15006 [Cladophialophora immunda]